MHVTMVHDVTCVRSGGVETVDLTLKRRIRLRVREEAMKYADDGRRTGL